MYALLTFGFMIVILLRLWYRCCFHIWTLKCYPSYTSSSCSIWTTQSQILLSLSPLAHNYINFICTKFWSPSSIISVPFASCIWTRTFNHSRFLIRNTSSSCLCKILQRYFYCEWTISSIPTSTTADQTSAVLQYSFSARFCSSMSHHALANRASITLYHPISSCVIFFPRGCLATSHYPGITPALSFSKISRRSVKGLDAFPDW